MRRRNGKRGKGMATKKEKTKEQRIKTEKTRLKGIFKDLDENKRKLVTPLIESSTNAAAVLPTQTLNEVIKKARTMGGIMGACRAFNIPSKVAVPIGTPAAAANWHTEGAAVESEKPETTSVTFDGYEIMKVFSISEKARKMSVSAFEGYMTQELNASVMECIANAIVNGTGSGQGTGLLTGITWKDGKNALTFGKTTGLKYADVVKTVAALKRGYANGAAWAMNNATLYNLFYGLVDANERPIFIADPKNEGIGKILGFPVIIDDYITDETAIFGNFNYMGYNLPEGITVEASRERVVQEQQETIEKQSRLIADLIATLESWEQTAGYDGAELKERAENLQLRERQDL